jgi:hypothetical protein
MPGVLPRQRFGRRLVAKMAPNRCHGSFLAYLRPLGLRYTLLDFWGYLFLQDPAPHVLVLFWLGRVGLAGPFLASSMQHTS